MERKTVIGMFIAFLMVASVFGVALDYIGGAQAKALTYNGFTFRPVQGVYQTTINDKPYVFNFYPQDLEYVQVPDDVKTALASPVITVTYDPTIPIADAAAQAQYYIETQFEGNTLVERGVTDNTNLTSLPLRTCMNATAAQPVLYLALANSSGVALSNNCVTLSAIDSYDLFRQTERITYQRLGIMP